MATEQASENPVQIVRYEAQHGEVELTQAKVREHFCKNASPGEAFHFMQMCMYHKLNPFLREVYLVKYSEKDPASIIISKDAWLSRAERDERYEGFRAGIILQTAGANIQSSDDGIMRREGALLLKGETLLGGWCEVKIRGRAWATHIEVSLSEYQKTSSEGKPTRFWREMPATMIRKVALAQAHREAFPSLFAGLYDQSEIGRDEDLPATPVIIEGQVREILETPPPSPNTDTQGYDDGPDFLGICPEHEEEWKPITRETDGHPVGSLAHKVDVGNGLVNLCWRD